jgi:hypothetical protein
VREALREAFGRSLAFDTQVEGTRTQYLFDLAESAGMLGALRGAALAGLREPRGRWDTDQFAAVALACARDEEEPDEESARVLRETFAAIAPGTDRFDSLAWAMIELDGVEGLLAVARSLGAAPEVEARTGSGSYMRAVAGRLMGEEKIEQELVAAAARDPLIASFLAAIGASNERLDRTVRAALEGPLELLLDALAPAPGKVVRPSTSIGWARRASPAELDRAVARLATATEPWLQEGLLHAFSMDPYPGPIAILLRLARAPEESVRGAAEEALSLLDDPAVRALALEHLTADPPRWQAIRLLTSTYQPGDGDLLVRALERMPPAEPERLHRVGFALLSALSPEEHGEDTIAPLRWLYERSPCSFCRNQVVGLLRERGGLDEEATAECAWDCNEETRALVASDEQGEPVASDEQGELNH